MRPFFYTLLIPVILMAIALKDEITKSLLAIVTLGFIFFIDYCFAELKKANFFHRFKRLMVTLAEYSLCCILLHYYLNLNPLFPKESFAPTVMYLIGLVVFVILDSWREHVWVENKEKTWPDIQWVKEEEQNEDAPSV